jgi:hypothetical protein
VAPDRRHRYFRPHVEQLEARNLLSITAIKPGPNVNIS